MSKFFDRAYSVSPVWLQQLAVASYGVWWYRKRFGADFHRLAKEFKSRDRWAAHQFEQYQSAQLTRLIHAASQSPYYRSIFRERAISATMPPGEFLRTMPPLAKEILRTRARDLLTVRELPKDAIVFRSSGTTGTPTEIFYTPEFHALEVAVPAARNLGWAGIGHRDRRVMLGVRKVCNFDQRRPPFWRFSPAENLAYASVYHLSPKFLPDYMAFFRRFKPTTVMGYPSALYTLAQYALAYNDMPAPAKGVFTTSETVTPSIRQAVEKAWSCRIYDRYGAVEGCMFASQCEFGQYHVSPEVGIVEIVDAHGNPAPPGVPGEVLCTGLQNMLQPLIRYRIGDVAAWSVHQTCPCGREMPILEGIDGRIEDMCETPDGRQILRFDTIFKGVENLKQAQVVQESRTMFVINVVPADGFGDRDIGKIRENMTLHVGEVEVRIAAVPEIPRTASGKFRAVICKLRPEDRMVASMPADRVS